MPCQVWAVRLCYMVLCYMDGAAVGAARRDGEAGAGGGGDVTQYIAM
jgi:hypothetical protein